MNENEQSQKPVFKTIKSLEKDYGTRNFIEIALKETNNNENVFFSISKGFKAQNGIKRYKNSLGFAASEELQQFLIDSLKELIETYKSLPKNQTQQTQPSQEQKAEETKEEQTQPSQEQKAEETKEEQTENQ